MIRKPLPQNVLALAVFTLTVFALTAVLGACSNLPARQASFAAQPGWGRGFSLAERELTVRAVPASAAPSVPIPRVGQPGWGSPVAK